VTGRPSVGDSPELRAAIEAVGGAGRLAQIIGVSRGTVYRWIGRQRPVGAIARIALAAIARHPEDFTNERKDG
jgi:DNA-binding transcriptional regulator YdaS (Cro superfamily)